MNLKENMHWNPEEEALLRRPVQALRTQGGDPSRVQAAAHAMMANRAQAQAPRPAIRFAVAAGATLFLAGVALWPRPVAALSLKAIVQAMQGFSARHERTFRPDKSGKLAMVSELWGEPGKLAETFVGSTESRSDGHVVYTYWPESNKQRIAPGASVEMDPVGIEEYEKSPYGKLLRVEKVGAQLRYVFQMGATRQDLIVNADTKLPVRREVFYPSDHLLETHEYEFFKDLPDSIFEPAVKPGVPLCNVFEDRKSLQEMLASKPQTQVVGGMTIRLRAVVVAGSCVAAIVSGEDPRSATSLEGLQVDGVKAWNVATHGDSTVWAGKLPSVGSPFTLQGETAVVERGLYLPDKSIPDEFVLRIPVWKYDPQKPLVDPETKKRVGIDTRLVGWAEFQVRDVLRTDDVDSVLPGYVPSGVVQTGTAKSE